MSPKTAAKVQQVKPPPRDVVVAELHRTHTDRVQMVYAGIYGLDRLPVLLEIIRIGEAQHASVPGPDGEWMPAHPLHASRFLFTGTIEQRQAFEVDYTHPNRGLYVRHKPVGEPVKIAIYREVSE